MVLERLDDLRDAKRMLGDFRDIRGTTVVNPRGDEVGRVTDLYVDPKQGKLAMAAISFGGRWGFGAKHVLVPIDQIEDISEQFVRVITTPEVIKEAPEFEPMHGVDFAKCEAYWRGAPAGSPSRESGATHVDVEYEEGD